jgi:hypothetical protein
VHRTLGARRIARRERFDALTSTGRGHRLPDQERPSHPCAIVSAMTDDEIIDAARSDGFELEKRVCRGQWVHGWRRGDDERWRCFLTRREALSWMDDRLARCAAFA